MQAKYRMDNFNGRNGKFKANMSHGSPNSRNYTRNSVGENNFNENQRNDDKNKWTINNGSPNSRNINGTNSNDGRFNGNSAESSPNWRSSNQNQNKNRGKRGYYNFKKTSDD